MSLVSQNLAADLELKDWREKEKTALELSKLVGDLRFDRSIELVLFRKDLYDARPSQIISDHLFAKNYIDKPLDLNLSLEISKIISKMDSLQPSRIDIGKLASEWEMKKDGPEDLLNFITSKLISGFENSNGKFDARDVVLYGFGRIGRLVARRLISQTGSGEQLRLKAIVVRAGMKDPHEEVLKRLALLETDSIHGNFPGAIEVSEDGKEAIINGNRIKIIFAGHPSEINYEDYGIKDALLIDNTGLYDTREKLSVHLRPGISEIILTAPGKDIPNIVVGVNHELADTANENIFCAASCTTNAIVPVIKVIDEAFRLEKGHIETVHAYTSDQNLLDNFHRKPRRGRGAPINMVITSTGAASAVAKVLPHLKGKLTGNAVRVPVPDVSLAILNLSLEKNTDKDQILARLRDASLHGELVEQLHYSNSNEYVSSNAVGTTCACVVDAPSTIMSADGKTVTIYAWYDNEFGYACQVVRLAKYVAKVRRFTYY
ncbi:MAG: glyceraldehyde-3-phosphate dehydrogenase [Saprospiraceae bacterium]|nr:glyceraldehyde-3-phosphate dehydrogenase [Saprospiraceae bacterium]